MEPVYQVSTKLVQRQSGEHFIFFHSLAGKAFRGNTRTADLLAALKTPQSIRDLASAVSAPVEAVNKVVDDLLKRKMVVPVVDGEPQEMDAADPELVSYPLRLFRLYVTKICNMACSYCFESEHDGPRMSLDTAKSAVRAFKAWLDETDMGGRELVKLNFFGGEPLVCLPLLKDITPYIYKVMSDYKDPWRITMNSNATLIKPDVARWIVDNSIHVYISLDGMRDTNDAQRVFRGGRGTFDRTLQGLQYLVEAGDEYYRRDLLTVLCTVTPASLPEIEELAETLHEIGVRNLSFNSAFNCSIHRGDKQDWTMLDSDELADFVKRVTALQERFLQNGFHIGGMWGHIPERLQSGGTVFCQAIGNEVGVDHLGRLFACPTSLDVPGAGIGMLDLDGRFIFNEGANDWRNRTSDNISGCIDCSLQGVCRGGCPAASILSGHDMYDNTQCDYWFNIVDAYLDQQADKPFYPA